MKQYYHFFIILLLTLLNIGCTEETDNHAHLGKAEHFMNAKFVSLSPCNDKGVWVGGETGRIWYYDDSFHLISDLGENRIYKVINTRNKQGDTLLIVAERNAGIQLYSKSKEWKVDKRYTLPQKGNNYSPYDLKLHQNILYAATSQGVYSTDISNPHDSLHLIYPPKDTLEQRSNYSFVAKHLTIYKDSILYAATEQGILKYDMTNTQQKVIAPAVTFSYATMNHDTLIALSGNRLTKYTLSGEQTYLKEFDFTPAVYYRAAGINYLITTSKIYIGKNLDKLTPVASQRIIPVNYSKNIVMKKPNAPYTLLLTENALWDIPFHLPMFGGDIAGRFISEDKGNVYILSTDNQLYCKTKGSNIAKHIYTFPAQEVIESIYVTQNHIYYYTSCNILKRVTLSKYSLLNALFRHPEAIHQFNHKITAWYVWSDGEKEYVYMGIQDGMVRVSSEGDIITYPTLQKSYITAFKKIPHSDMLVLSTLNEGAFALTPATDAITKIKEDTITTSTRDFIVDSSYPLSLVTLSGRGIFTTEEHNYYPIKDMRKLLPISDTTFIGLPEFGITLFAKRNNHIIAKKTIYQDIHFFKAASVIQDSTLYLGSDLGVLQMPLNLQKKAEWITFESVGIFNLHYSILIFVFVFLLIGITLFYLYKLMISRKRQIKRRIREVSKRIEGLSLFPYMQEEEQSQLIAPMYHQLKTIENSSMKHREKMSAIAAISDKVLELNREASLHLSTNFNEVTQALKEWNTPDARQLIQQGRQIDVHQNINGLIQYVSECRKYLHDITAIRQFMMHQEEIFHHIAEIEGVNLGILSTLRRLQVSLKEISFKELSNDINQLKQQINYMDSIEGLEKIKEYFNQKRIQILSLPQDDGTQKLLHEISTVNLEKADNSLSLLKVITPILQEAQFLIIKHDIAEIIHEYSQIAKKIIADNEELIHKKFDRELEVYISEQTKEQVRKIDELIPLYYHFVQQVEQEVIDDILKLGNIENQQAKVLALLIAQPKVKRLYIPGLLGITGNLNPVISRLVNAKIKTNEEKLKQYIEENPQHCCFALYCLKLSE